MVQYAKSLMSYKLIHDVTPAFDVWMPNSLKGRGLAAGIPHFNLDRLASSSMASHRLIQHVGKRYGLDVSEALYDRLNV